ncbi:hypothetical protein DRN82_07195 [Thermococci archaeon]|nr:MAG: hypothetical protein DRN82_07195 [Thermococci archaeon]
MRPPFIYGRIVDKEHFADREEELEKLKKRIPGDEFAKFILKKFEESRLAVEAEVIGETLNITKGHPHYTQMLCQKLWLNAVIQGKKED